MEHLWPLQTITTHISKVELKKNSTLFNKLFTGEIWAKMITTFARAKCLTLVNDTFYCYLRDNNATTTQQGEYKRTLIHKFLYPISTSTDIRYQNNNEIKNYIYSPFSKKKIIMGWKLFFFFYIQMISM